MPCHIRSTQMASLLCGSFHASPMQFCYWMLSHLLSRQIAFLLCGSFHASSIHFWYLHFFNIKTNNNFKNSHIVNIVSISICIAQLWSVTVKVIWYPKWMIPGPPPPVVSHLCDQFILAYQVLPSLQSPNLWISLKITPDVRSIVLLQWHILTITTSTGVDFRALT